jgi:hypothetical protein
MVMWRLNSEALAEKTSGPTGDGESTHSPAAQSIPSRVIRQSSGQTSRAKVRMYRQGLGDCFLITIPRINGNPYYIVIDCGVILGTPDPVPTMTKVVEDIIKTTNGHLDLVAATHEHWDHLSGLVQARDLWQKNLRVDQVWLGWTEDPKDQLAIRLRGERKSLREALTIAANRMRMTGMSEGASDVEGMLEFFGASAGSSTADALNVVKSLSTKVRYCLPQDAPVTLEGTAVKVYVLGPPNDEKLIKKYNPSTKEPETYGIDAMNAFLSGMVSALQDSELSDPFDASFEIPSEAAKQMPFFHSGYWGEDPDAEEKDAHAPTKDQSWRRIDGSWLESSSSMALQLDSATNNTCLVLAFELDGGDVLLFAADAQVGNWISWQQLKWDDVGGKKVTGPDLLRRTVFYKVGHHGSHNATLKEQGLEEMIGLKLAFVPVDHAMAVKKHWDRMPFPELMDRLAEKSSGHIVRIDSSVPASLKEQINETELFFEVSF